ncbi:MAG: hypothetical protein AAFN41_12410 [Planctomycetota bacterium]
MSLEQDIHEWDGRSADAIARVFETHHCSSDFACRLVHLASDPTLERGATWLLKRGLESGRIRLEADSIEAFYKLFATASDWGAGLHLMQCVPHVPIPKSADASVASLLDRSLTDRRAIVRAWAYWGYHELALVAPRYRNEAESLLLDAAESETAASVRVRVRRALEARGLA